jgi:hypothetical protein
MRYFVLIATVAMAAALGACHKPGGVGAGGTCPANGGSGPPQPSVTYSDQFINVATSGPLVIKPKAILPTADPGLCVDQGSGDVHLYHNQATHIALILTFDPSLNLLWPNDPTAAFDVSPQATYQPTEVSADHKTLTVFLQAKNGGQKYPYVATYLDSNGNPFHTEPGIQNH